MTGYNSDYIPQAHEALFTTPTALMLDARLTPLERNGWQVLRMLRASSLANLAQLRRDLTSTPLGQRAVDAQARQAISRELGTSARRLLRCIWDDSRVMSEPLAVTSSTKGASTVRFVLVI